MKVRNLMGNDKASDKRTLNKARIAKHILYRGQVSKPELAAELGISMPTILQNVKELIDAGIVEEVGEYESTGGRKAKALSIASRVKFAAGIDITANHISFVLIDLKGEAVGSRRVRRVYENTPEYYADVAGNLKEFIADSGVNPELILGVGVSLPGIIDRNQGKLIRSHILNVADLNLEVLGRLIPYEVRYENDANSAAVAELRGTMQNAVYLSLSNTVGGSIYFHNRIYNGDNFRSAEFGHMILVPGGKTCYCGKKGCSDAYCSAKVLSSYLGEEGTLAGFFDCVERKDAGALAVLDKYLEHLAIMITNLRMAFDCQIVLGGYVGGYLKQYLTELGKKAIPYNRFDNDMLYVKTCRYDKEASAIGIAMTFVEKYFEVVN